MPAEYRYKISLNRISDFESTVEHAQLVRKHKITNEILLPVTMSHEQTQIQNLKEEITQLKDTIDKPQHISNKQAFKGKQNILQNRRFFYPHRVFQNKYKFFRGCFGSSRPRHLIPQCRFCGKFGHQFLKNSANYSLANRKALFSTYNDFKVIFIF